MSKTPTRSKRGKKKTPRADAQDLELELDDFHEDDGAPLFGSSSDEGDDFIDDLADGDVEDDLGTSIGDDDFDLDALGGYDANTNEKAGGPLGKLKGLFKGRGDPFEDDDPHYRDSDDDGESRGRLILHSLAVLLLGGALVGGYFAVSGAGHGDQDPAASTAAHHPLPASGSDPTNGLMTPPSQSPTPGEAGAQGLTATDRSLERRPWLNDNTAATPEAVTPAPSAAVLPAPAAAPAPASLASAEPVATQPAVTPPAAVEPTAVMGASPEPAAPTAAPAPVDVTAEADPSMTAAPNTSTMTSPSQQTTAFQRPAGQLLPTPSTSPPSAPPFPVEDGFRPGRMPSYADLPAAGSLGGTPLPDAPLTELLRTSESGLLPVIAEDGRMPWRTYARPFTGNPTLPRIAIIVDGLGLRNGATEAAIGQTPPDVTLAFSPYAENLAVWMGRARQMGHETLLDLPVEPLGFPAMDPGPLALLSAVAELENRKRLDSVLGRAGGYVGLLATAAGRFTDTPATMRPLLQSLKTRGLLYVHRGDEAAVNANNDIVPPVNQVTTEIDQNPFQRAIDTRLTYLEEEARTQGFAVGVIGASPVALYRLTRWLGTLQSKGFALAPVSAVMLTGERGPTQ